jgi:multicomponent Na+:H+ antiporter subunit D
MIEYSLVDIVAQLTDIGLSSVDIPVIAPPAIFILAIALILPALSRRVGHGLGVLVTAGVAIMSLFIRDGTYLAVNFLGFDAVLLFVDSFSRLMGVIFGTIGAAAVVYSYSSNATNRQTAFALGYVGTSIGSVFAGDWLTLIFFWELMAVTSSLLVWDYGGEAVRAGFRYAIYHGVGGSLLLAAIIWQYVEVGSFLFSASQGLTAGVPAVLGAIGIGVNVGFVGLHPWLPDTYPRPHIAASVFLSVYTTKTGVYGLARAFPNGNLAVAYMGTAMALVGVIYALLQNDMRRLLSYHIQSQVGYMVAGVGIGTALATAGAFAHVFNHILYKALLFMTAGVVIAGTQEENLKYLGGLKNALPLTGLAFVIAALSISGFPGFNGFVSKGMITGAAHKKHLDGIFYILLAAGVGTFMSFIKFGYYAFVREAESVTPVQSSRTGQRVAMLSVAGLCVLFGLFPEMLFSILPGSTAKADPFTLSHLSEGAILATLGIIGFAVLKKPLSKITDVPDIDRIVHPAVFYATRGLVRGTTEIFALVDALLVRLSSEAIDTINNPARVTNVVPGFQSEQAPAEIRSSGVNIGTGALLVVLTAVMTLTLTILM